jgi:hypothetical protein
MFALDMMLRDYFASAALTGLLSQHLTQECDSGNRDFEPLYCDGEERRKCVTRAYEIADAMLAEREKKQE